MRAVRRDSLRAALPEGHLCLTAKLSFSTPITGHQHLLGKIGFLLLCVGHAQVVHANEENNFFTHDFERRRDLSTREPEPDMVHAISFTIRVPKVIVLLLVDRMPRKEVKFTRHNIFKRDENTCQYCGTISTGRSSFRSCHPRGTRSGSQPGKHHLLVHPM